MTALLVAAAAGTTDKRHTAVDSEDGDLIMPKCNSSLHYNRLKGWGSCPLLATCKNGSCSCFESKKKMIAYELRATLSKLNFLNTDIDHYLSRHYLLRHKQAYELV